MIRSNSKILEVVTQEKNEIMNNNFDENKKIRQLEDPISLTLTVSTLEKSDES
jgi:hypothetical protein